MKWHPEERSDALLIAALMERAGAARRTVLPSSIVIRESERLPYRDGLAGSRRAVFTRHLSRLAGLSEEGATAWRMEHKLLQAHLLDHYAPGVMPLTIGASRFDAVLPWMGIKSALGDSSGDRRRWLETVPDLGEPPEFITGERLIAQEFVHIETEYRVHSVEDEVVDDLTFHRYRGGDLSPDVRAAPNSFVQSVLDRLPAAVVRGSLLGWDVARARDGRFIVIEVNVSGFHFVHRRGYHCSGYLQDRIWGPKLAACLIRHLRDRRGMQVEVVCNGGEPSPDALFYREVYQWLKIVDDERRTAERSREVGRQARAARLRENRNRG